MLKLILSYIREAHPPLALDWAELWDFVQSAIKAGFARVTGGRYELTAIGEHYLREEKSDAN